MDKTITEILIELKKISYMLRILTCTSYAALVNEETPAEEAMRICDQFLKSEEK